MSRFAGGEEMGQAVADQRRVVRDQDVHWISAFCSAFAGRAWEAWGARTSSGSLVALAERSLAALAERSLAALAERSLAALAERSPPPPLFFFF